VNKR